MDDDISEDLKNELGDDFDDDDDELDGDISIDNDDGDAPASRVGGSRAPSKPPSTTGARPGSRATGKAGSTAADDDDDASLGLSLDEDRSNGNFALNSKPASKSPSKTPSLASGPPPSRPPTAPPPPRSETSRMSGIGTPAKPSPRGSEAATPAASAPASKAPSVAPSASMGRVPSVVGGGSGGPAGSWEDEELAELLDDTKRGPGSVAREPSTTGSVARAPSISGSVARAPSVSGAATPMTAAGRSGAPASAYGASPVPSPPASLIGSMARPGSAAGARGSVAGASRVGGSSAHLGGSGAGKASMAYSQDYASGSATPMNASMRSTFPGPEQSDSPDKLSHPGSKMKHTLKGAATALQASAKFQRLTMKIDIPTPFGLFRLYDQDNSGCVTHNEFIHLLRDIDTLPHHFAPDEDPEVQVAHIKAKLEAKQKQLTTRSETLSTIQKQSGTRQDDIQGMQQEVDVLSKQVAELHNQLATWQAAAAELLRHPDAEVRVTPEMRLKRKQWRDYAESEFKRSDMGGNNMLSIDEFYMYYYGKLCFRFPVLRTGVNPGASLFNIYVKYCSFGRHSRSEEMLGHQFAKLAKDAGLINARTVTKAIIDIIYHRARAADEALETFQAKPGVAATARMYYQQFLFGLNLIAEKRKSGFQEVVAKIIGAISSLPSASMADFVMLSSSDLEPGDPVPEYLQRHRLLPANETELPDNDMIVRMKEEAAYAMQLTMGIAPKATQAEGLAEAIRKAKENRTSTTNGAQAAPGSATPGGAAAGADASQSREYSEFGSDPAASAAAGGHGHSHGGQPTTTGAQGAAAAIYASLPPPAHDHEFLRSRGWERQEPTALQACQRGAKALGTPNTLALVRGLDPDTLMMSLKRVFDAYCAWNNGLDRGAMDKSRFSKALRDAQLVSESGMLPVRKVEGIYKKCLPASNRAINFVQFIEALRHVAVVQRSSLNEVMERLVAVGGPQ